MHRDFLKPEPVARTQKLLDAARDYPCSWCNRKDGTIVPAHCNELALGHGMGLKVKDYLIAYLCHDCHSAVDGRSHGLSKEEKRAMWNRSFVVSQSWLWRDGIIKVA